MNQSILSKGRDVMEAIEMGLKLLGTNRDQVSIEVIQQETKGFLRLGMKPAIVKITKLTPLSSEQNNKEKLAEILEETDISVEELDKVTFNQEPGTIQLSSIQEDKKPLEGMAWIKDGVIYGKCSNLQYPTITVGKVVDLFKNNELVTGTTIIAEEDQFEIKTHETIKETKWNLKVDSQNLQVFLNVEPGVKQYYRIIDKEPDTHIVVEAEEVIEVKNDLEYKTVLESMETLKVIHGFNHSEIMNAINTDKPGIFTIASGVKPKKGVNGKLELVVNTDKKVGPQQRSDGTVDYREVHNIPVVNKGQVIALIHPPVPGVPGYSVSNEPIPPEPSYPLIVQTGKGVTLIENGQKIVATEPGRPLIEQRGLLVKVSILPKLVHFANVNISSGNIRFKGDVDILGDVDEGMVVEADGYIHVLQNANRATISSKTAVNLEKNSIGSTISAGKHNIFVSEMVYQLITIHEQFNKLILSIQQLMILPAFKTTDFKKRGLLPIIKLLLEKKFHSILTPVEKFIDSSKKGVQILDMEWVTLAEQIRLCLLSPIANEFHSMERLLELSDRMEELIQKHLNLNEQQCFVSLMYAINSNIYSGGDVIVRGQGCYNSKIHAGGSIKIAGVLRGGEVYARKGATIKATGSDGGALTKIMVPGNQNISIDLVKEGTVIQIGKVMHTFQDEYRNINARLDESEKLIF